MKIINQIIFLVLLCFACVNRVQKNDKVNHTEIDETGFNGLSVGNNGLVSAFKGDWINSSLFDSTMQKRKLAPWLYQFYGNLHLLVGDSDSVLIQGNMDGGKSVIKLIDSISFSIPDRVDIPVFTYSPEKDLIFQKSDYRTIVYRRVKDYDNLSIIMNQEIFDRFFIIKFFADYFTDNEIDNIITIWDGFETHTPFDFDTIGIKADNDSIRYYAWKFNEDTLELYNTSFKYDDDSGFAMFEIEDLWKILSKK